MLEQQLRRTLYLASRSTDKRLAGAAWAAYTFLQRAAAGSPVADCRAKVGTWLALGALSCHTRLCCLAALALLVYRMCSGPPTHPHTPTQPLDPSGSTPSAQGEESAQAAATDFFDKKKSRLQRQQLEALLRRLPALVPAALPGVVQQAGAARNEHLRLEALQLLAAILKVGRLEPAGVPVLLLLLLLGGGGLPCGSRGGLCCCCLQCRC